MRNSFELLDWLKEHLGGSGGDGGAVDAPLADSVAPDGVAACAEGKFVPLVAKAVHHESVTNEATAGEASCEECASGVLLTLNLSVTANVGTVAVSFPLDHAERFGDAHVRFLIDGAWYDVCKNGPNLALRTTGALTRQSCRATVFVPYF